MKNGIYSSTAGMLVGAERLNVIANNMANISTHAFKEDLPFEQAIKFYSQQPYPGKDQPCLGGTVVNFAPGSIRTTGRNLDLAIEGDGFLTVSGPNQEKYYTRDGALQINSKRGLVTPEGYPVLDKFDKPITVFGEKFYFSGKGEIFVDEGYLTSLKVVDFKNKKDLEKIGDHFYIDKQNTGQAQMIEEPHMVVGALEGSNVELSKTMNSLIITQRAFEFQQSVLNTVLRMISQSISDVARPV